MNLYLINQQRRLFLDNAFDQETGEVLNEDYYRELIDLDGQFEASILDLGMYYQELDADEVALKSQIDRLGKKLDSVKKRKETIKRTLQTNLTVDSKYKNDIVSIGFRKSSYVAVENVDNLPTEYKKEKIEINPDKTAITKAIKEGKVIVGAILEERYNIQIK